MDRLSEFLFRLSGVEYDSFFHTAESLAGELTQARAEMQSIVTAIMSGESGRAASAAARDLLYSAVTTGFLYGYAYGKSVAEADTLRSMLGDKNGTV